LSRFNVLISCWFSARRSFAALAAWVHLVLYRVVVQTKGIETRAF
jgi:hypothetical protein